MELGYDKQTSAAGTTSYAAAQYSGNITGTVWKTAGDGVGRNSYQTNSNKLSQVTDAMNDPSSKLGDFHFTGTRQATDYSYDGNGNLVLDNNKAISAIAYNYLNLPRQVTIASKGTVSYTYDASGTKLFKTKVDNPIYNNNGGKYRKIRTTNPSDYLI